MLDRFGTTIEKIYAAAGDASLWEDALTAVQDLSGSTAVVVNLVAKARLEDSRMLLTPSVYELATEAELASYNEDVLPHCPRVAAGAANPDAPFVCDYMILSEAEMDRNVAYDWYTRHGLRYFIGAPLLETSHCRFMWSVQRSPRQGHAQQKDVDLFQRLQPHVARAISLADQLGTLRRFERFSCGVFHSLPQPLFALDEFGRLVFANDAATELIRNGDGLSTGDERLRLASSTEQDSFDALIASAADVGTFASTGWTRITRPSGKTPYAVFVSPLRTGGDGFDDASARVLVVVHDSAARRSVEPEMLSAIYGLTESEARLASAISAGHSLESASALLHVQIATARSHLKSIFNKMDVHRQQDLVGLLASLSMVKF